MNDIGRLWTIYDVTYPVSEWNTNRLSNCVESNSFIAELREDKIRLGRCYLDMSWICFLFIVSRFADGGKMSDGHSGTILKKNVPIE